MKLKPSIASIGVSSDERAEYDKQAKETLERMKLRHEKFKRENNKDG